MPGQAGHQHSNSTAAPFNCRCLSFDETCIIRASHNSGQTYFFPCASYKSVSFRFSLLNIGSAIMIPFHTTFLLSPTPSFTASSSASSLTIHRVGTFPRNFNLIIERRLIPIWPTPWNRPQLISRLMATRETFLSIRSHRSQLSTLKEMPFVVK